MVAWAQIELERSDDAFATLNAIAENFDQHIVFFMHYPRIAPLRSDPRSTVLLRRAGFSPGFSTGFSTGFSKKTSGAINHAQDQTPPFTNERSQRRGSGCRGAMARGDVRGAARGYTALSRHIYRCTAQYKGTQTRGYVWLLRMILLN